MHRRTFLTAAIGTVGAAALPPLRVAGAAAPPPLTTTADFGAEIAVLWFERALSLVRSTPGFSPPVASRAFGYAGVTLYETVVPGIPGHRSLAGIVAGLPASAMPGRNVAYHWGVAANASLARILRLLFPTAPETQRAAVDALESRLARELALRAPPGIVARSVERGQAVAALVFDWSRTDGGHEGFLRNFPTTYMPPTGPGLWRPTPPAFQRALQPFWGTNRPFAVPSAELGHPGPPLPFSADPSSACFAEALEVYETVNGLTDEQRATARFWSDDPGATSTPSGHSVSILTQVLRSRGASLDVAAKAYAKVGMAVADAFICCWRLKFRYNLLRPITYITDHIDPTFGPAMPLVTPPFPEYTSGHSEQSAAAATILTDLFGAVPFTDHTHDDRGLAPRQYASFTAAAAEAGIARLYGGIHFRRAIELGLAQGRSIGRHISDLPLTA